MMRQDRFTEQAQEVLQASQELVRQHRHPQWDVEHILLALLNQRDGLAMRVFEKLAVPVDQIRERIAAALGNRPKQAYDSVQVYITPRTVGVLEAANAEAERLKDEYVGVEHILIAIADERDGESARILRSFGVDKERRYRALQDARGTARRDTPRAESHYQSLEKYSVDLPEAARQGKLDPVIGREE